MQFMLPKTKVLRDAARLPNPRRDSIRPIRLAVIGHARSGTTVLLNAFNSCPDIYMMGEPFSYWESGEKNFRDRFNAKHVGYRHHPSKSTYAPVLPNLPEDADLSEYFEALSEHYPIYGEKIALASPRYGHDPAKLMLWVEINRPHCLFVFRAPQSTIASMPRLLPNLTLEENIYSYAMTMRLYFDLARTLPNIRHIIHEDISARTFNNLGNWLDLDLSFASGFYDKRHQAARRASAETPEIATLISAYDFLSRQTMRTDTVLPWRRQITGSLAGSKLSEINKIYKNLVDLMDKFRRYTIAA